MLGRTAFTERHGMLVGISIVVYLISFLITAGLTLSFADTIMSGALNSISSFESTFMDYIIGVLVVRAFGGLAYVLLVLGIATSRARILLWVAFAASIAVGIAVVVIVTPLIDHAAVQLFTFHNNSFAKSALNEITYLKLFDAIPNLTFAGAYYMICRGVDSGEVKVIGY